MALADLKLRKFAYLASKDDFLNKQRQESIAAGRTEEADAYFLEMVPNRNQAEEFAVELRYLDFDAAKKDILLMLAR
jgi:hypothetical protein